MAKPARPPVLVGKPMNPRTERVLWVALAPMLADVRATLPKIETEADARALAGALRKRYTDAKIHALVSKAGALVERAASSQWRVVDAAIRRAPARKDAKAFDGEAFDGEALVAKWTKTAVDLITSVRDEAIESIRADVVRALEDGTSATDLAARWIARGVPLKFGTLEGRMKVIAQHQVANLNELVRVERARAIGVTESVWHHSGQASPPARAEHVKLDGRKYDNDEPPNGVRPGELPNCHCWAQSVIPASLVSSLGLGSVFER